MYKKKVVLLLGLNRRTAPTMRKKAPQAPPLKSGTQVQRGWGEGRGVKMEKYIGG